MAWEWILILVPLIPLVVLVTALCAGDPKI